MDRVAEAVESPANQTRHEAPDPRVTVYLENIGWTQLFGYDVNRYYDDPAFNCAMQLRQKLYAFETFDDDTPIDTTLSAALGWYFDLPCVGLDVTHQPNGVPHIRDDTSATTTRSAAARTSRSSAATTSTSPATCPASSTSTKGSGS